MIPVLSCSCLLSQRQTDTGFPVGYQCEFCCGLQELLVLSALRSHLQRYPTIPFFIASVKLLWKYVLKETGCKTHLKTFYFSPASTGWCQKWWPTKNTIPAILISTWASSTKYWMSITTSTQLQAFVKSEVLHSFTESKHFKKIPIYHNIQR